jgi:hypothetical protein
MAMRKGGRDRRRGHMRRGDTFAVTFDKCAGECKVFVTKIITDPITPDIKAVNPGDTWKGKDATKAADDLKAAINKWGEPVEIDPKCKTGCKCTDIDTDDVDWTKKKTHTRTFENPFESNKKKFKAEVDIDFKVAIVTKACIEPQGVPIKPV